MSQQSTLFSQDMVKGNLADRFGAPPFSVLDARSGYWRRRKAEWLALGIEPEVSHESVTRPKPGTDRQLGRQDLASRTERAAAAEGVGDVWLSNRQSAASVFDPVLTELMYRWFSPTTPARILDPFAGGSVRGIVASLLGHSYTGIELSPRQVDANERQARAIVPANPPQYIIGDSRHLLSLVGKPRDFDLIFSCPPYFDLEVYSMSLQDLSNIGSYDLFLRAYRLIIRQAAAALAPDRFAVWVVGEVRDRRGMQRGLVADTVQAFRDAGLSLYNEGILVTQIGSLVLRAGKHFLAGRKLGRAHQTVLIFWKGNGTPLEAFPRLSEALQYTSIGEEPAA